MQREDVEHLARTCSETGHNHVTATEVPRVLRYLIDRAEKAEAERGAAFAAGLQSAVAICKRVRDEVAESDDEAVWALECALAIMDAVNALEAKPRP